MTASLFFYGTLCHIPLLERVLGRSAAEIECADATLKDHYVTWVEDQPFPMIAAQPGALATGVIVSGLSTQDLARLNFYEGGFSYTLTDLTVQTTNGIRQAQVYLPEPGLWAPGPAWNLSDWSEVWGAITLSAAEEAMALFGTRSPEQMAHLMPFLRSRGWARQLAQDSAPSSLRRSSSVEDIEIDLRDEGYKGFFRFDTFGVRYRRFDGAQSEWLERGGFVSFDAALVLPYDPVRDEVLLVEQMRYGPLLRGDPKPWVLEPIAGFVNAGEDPVLSAKREAQEEANLSLNKMLPAGKVYASPGYATDYFHLFVGLTNLADRQSALGGLAVEHEDIRSHVISFDQAMELLDSGEINVGPLAQLLLWLALKRPELQKNKVS